MTDTFTLVHLSDVHLTPTAGLPARHWNVKRGLGYINWRNGRKHLHLTSVADLIAADARAQNPDHIAVTGDLANFGLPGEYATALTWLKNLGDPDMVSVVPGNHDIYSGRLGHLCLTTWAPYMQGNEGAAQQVPARFPYVRKHGPVALVGLNSAVPTPPFVAAGRLGDDQIRAAGEVLERLGAEGFIRVVMIHHPPLPGLAPPRRALADADAFAATLDRAGADLVLHGHNHRQMLSWRTHSGRGIPVLGVASASAGLARAHKDEPLARSHVLRIRRDAGAVTIDCETRGLATEGGEIVSLGRQTLSAPI
jgi:3',5'-cyclic AMP phosphodiesterase CpdA